MIVSEYLNAILLGIVQGIAEFLPISSSGHLVIANELLQASSGSPAKPNENFELTAALHVGSLASILVVYRNDLSKLLARRRICGAIIVATLPLIAVGICLILSEQLKTLRDAVFSDPLVAGCGLLATAVILVVGQRMERDQRPLDEITNRRAIAIGLFQMLALVPGVSRSGFTIAGGILNGLGRDAATTFSFFIAIPAIAGAGALAARETWQGRGGDSSLGALLVGTFVSFLVGLVALRLLIRIVSQRRLHWFAWYCAAAGSATIIWQLARRLAAEE